MYATPPRHPPYARCNRQRSAPSHLYRFFVILHNSPAPRLDRPSLFGNFPFIVLPGRWPNSLATPLLPARAVVTWAACTVAERTPPPTPHPTPTLVLCGSAIVTNLMWPPVARPPATRPPVTLPPVMWPGMRRLPPHQQRVGDSDGPWRCATTACPPRLGGSPSCTTSDRRHRVWGRTAPCVSDGNNCPAELALCVQHVHSHSAGVVQWRWGVADLSRVAASHRIVHWPTQSEPLPESVRVAY